MHEEKQEGANQGGRAWKKKEEENACTKVSA